MNRAGYDLRASEIIRMLNDGIRKMDRCQGKCLLTGIATSRIRVRRAIDAARNLGVNVGTDNNAAMLTGGQVRFDN